jgi:hypothetical protein
VRQVRFHVRATALGRAVVLLTALLALGVLASCASAATPQITSVVPNSGSVLGGQTVTINGSGFLGTGGACAKQTGIMFGIDWAHAYAISPSNYKILSDSQIRVTTPPNFGVGVNVRVYNSCGITPIVAGDWFTYTYPASQCLSGACSVTIGSPQAGSLTHSALGLLDGVNTDAVVSSISVGEYDLLKSLAPRQWRLGQSGLSEPGGGEFGLARDVGAKISLDLTSDWTNMASTWYPADTWAPYKDLSIYYNFIYEDVEKRIAAGMTPTYYDVWNEPANVGTVNQWLSVYDTAYRAIKAADPSAQVVGPSLGWPLFTSAGHPDTPGYDLSLPDFLNWEMTTGDRFAAVSYHEDGTTVDTAPNSAPGPGLPSEPVPGGYRDYWSPAAIGDHVRAAKAVIAHYSALKGTQVFVNEYGPTYANNEPGWMIGDLTSLESAGVDQAMLTCPTSDACNTLVDGLIGADGSAQMPYWVMLDYAQQSGARLQASTSGTNWYALATQAGANTLEALIGRADDCWGGQCPQMQASTHQPAGLSLSVKIPWSASAVTISVQRLPNSATNPIGANDVPSAPSAVSSVVPVTGGAAALSIPAVDDGDALYVVVTPAQSASTQLTALRNATRRSQAGSRRAPRRRPQACQRGSRLRARPRSGHSRSCTRPRRG